MASKATQANHGFGVRRQGGKGRGKRQANAMTIEGSSVVNNTSHSSYEVKKETTNEVEDNMMVFLPVNIGSKKFDALIDTGANQNFVSEEAVRRAGIVTKKTKPKELRMADGTVKMLDEKAFLTVKCGEWTFCDEFVVAPIIFK